MVAAALRVFNAGLALLLILASGCAVGPDYARPDVPVPTQWDEHAPGVSRAPADLGAWWQTLGDEELDSLIGRALAGNLDLRQAVSRVDEARALYQVSAAAQFPLIDSNGNVTYERGSENGLIPGGEAVTDYNVGLSASWEVDIFGRVRRSVEAAGATVQATEEQRRDVLVSVCAEVANTYVNIRTLQKRLQVNYSNLDSQGQIVELTRVRFEGGLASGLDVAQAESVYAETRTGIPNLERQLEEQLNGLSVLLGEAPGSVHNELSPPAPIPTPPATLGAGLPVDLVRQRPDIREAERQLAAQTARIGVATADLYPRFVLLGTFGFDATDFATMFNGGSRTFTVGPAVRWNVFDAGRIRGFIHAEEARTAQALDFYELTILRGLLEVENALVAYARLRDEKGAVTDAVRAATVALDLATDLYKDGVVDFQNVLDAQRTVLRFQETLAITDGNITQSIVQLYRALGGGWQLDAPPPAQEEEQTVAGR